MGTATLAPPRRGLGGVMSRIRRSPDLRSSGTVWAVDLETTGLDPQEADIIAVGMVPVVDGAIRLGRGMRTLVAPCHGDPTDGIVAHHLRPADLAGAPDLATVLPVVLSLLAEADAVLVHHAPLDVTVLRRAAAGVGVALPHVRVIDSVAAVQQCNRRRAAIGSPMLPTPLGQARAALGLPAYEAHDPLSDAVATAELWLTLDC